MSRVLLESHLKSLKLPTFVAGALLDRLTHRVHVLEMAGDSYRLKAGRRSGKRTAVTGPVVDDEVEVPGEEEEAGED